MIVFVRYYDFFWVHERETYNKPVALQTWKGKQLIDIPKFSVARICCGSVEFDFLFPQP